MGLEIILIIIGLVGGISLYDYFSSRKWAQITSETRNDVVFEHRNRNYGAYQLRRNYDRWMVIILLCLIGLIGLSYGSYRAVKYFSVEVEEQKTRVDETQFAIAAPPEDEEEVPPPPPEPEVPEVQKVVQFVEPEVTDKVEEAVKPPVNEDLVDENIGKEDIEGKNDPFANKKPENKAPEVEKKEPEKPLSVLDEKAQYPGGQSALSKFLGQNLVYPESAIQAGTSGKVYLKFVVDKTGKISEVTVLKGVPGCKECDREAQRVVRMMPKWVPGKNKGATVDSYFTLPIAFQLQ